MLYELKSHEAELITRLRQAKPFDEYTISVNQTGTQWSCYKKNTEKFLIRVVEVVKSGSFEGEEELIEKA